MMLLIAYDLNKPGQDYSGLHDEIKKADLWWHYLESTWIISTNLSPNTWTDRLRKHIDKNDHVLVIEVCDNFNGWLPKKAWDWLHQRDFEC